MWSVWFIFCDCGFHSLCPLTDKDKRFTEASRWERLTGGETGSVLMDKAILSKSLIQFSVDGQGCCLTWDQAMVEVMKITETSFKKSCARTATLSAPNPAAGHDWPTSLPETPGHSQASLGQSLVGSLLLSPGSWCTRLCLCPPRVCFSSPV